MPRSTGIDSGRFAAAGCGASAAGAIAAYAAAIVAFAYALVSLYWAVGGRGLVGTVGGFVEQMARRGGAAVMLLALVAVAAKAVGGLVALALVRPWGRVVRGRLLLIVSAAASVLLIVYGGSERGCRCAGPVGCPAPFGVREPDGLALACGGLGPVVPGVGDLAGAGNCQLLAAGREKPRRRVTAQATAPAEGSGTSRKDGADVAGGHTRSADRKSCGRLD